MFATLVYVLAALAGVYGVYRGTREIDDTAALVGLGVAVVAAAAAALSLGHGAQYGAAPAVIASLMVVNPEED